MKVLRKDFGVRYGKAYKMSSKRPVDAEGILKSLSEVFEFMLSLLLVLLMRVF
jgi:hypothetical protein